jgi:hypothetical protein
MKSFLGAVGQKSFSQLTVDQRSIFGWQNSTETRIAVRHVRLKSFPFGLGYGPLTEKIHLGFSQMFGHSWCGVLVPLFILSRVSLLILTNRV